MGRLIAIALSAGTLALMSGCNKASESPAAGNNSVAATSPLSGAPVTAPNLAAGDDLLGYSCANYLSAVEAAKPDEKASAEQKEAIGNAQDDVFNAVLWTHGYQAGRGGTTAAAPALTKDWVVQTVGKLVEACQKNSPDGSMRLADAAAKL